MCALVFEGQRLTLGISFGCCPCYILDSLSLNWELTDLAVLTGQQALGGPPVLASPMMGLLAYATMPSVLCWFLRLNSDSLACIARHFINWPVLLVSKQIMSGLLKIEMRQFSFRKKCSCSCTILRFEIPKAWLSSISKRHLHTLHCDVWHLGVVHTHNANIQEAEVERFLWVWVSLSYRVRLCSKQ